MPWTVLKADFMKLRRFLRGGGSCKETAAVSFFKITDFQTGVKRREDMKEEKIYTAVTDSGAALYWKRPFGSCTGDRFSIFCENTGKSWETENTYLTVEGLEPEKTYTFVIRWLSGFAVRWSVPVQIRTKKKRRRLDVTEAPYWAKGDGKTKNTRAIQKAIEDCGPEEEVYIPQGVFLTGALPLHSHMAVYLETGAVLQGTSDPEDYLPKRISRFEGIERECYQSLLNLGRLDHTGGCSQRDVLLYGKGAVLGGGKELAERIIETERKERQEKGKEPEEENSRYECADTIPGRARGRLIQLCNCENIRITGLTLGKSPSWNVHMIYSKRILTDQCRFYSEGIWNGDGWDPDSSSECCIFACRFRTGDDAIAVKSGKNPEGNRIARACRDISIFGCTVEEGHGFAVGSEISGGIHGVCIWDCDLRNARYGIEIKGTGKRGAYVKDIQVQNCRVSGLHVHEVNYNDDGEAAPNPPVFSGFSFKNLVIAGDGEPTLELIGFPQKGYSLRNVCLEGILLETEGRIQIRNCENLVIKNLKKGENFYDTEP